MAEINIFERLQRIKKDPVYKSYYPAVGNTDVLTKKWSGNNSIKLLILSEINSILKDFYTPLDCWKQNPSTPLDIGIDLGVVINNHWSYINLTDTNYSVHKYIFNKCNYLILNECIKHNVKEITINGISYSKDNLFKFEPNWSVTKTNDKLKEILSVVRHFNEFFFSPGSEGYNVIIKTTTNTMNLGDKSQDIVVKNINKIFSDVKEIECSTGLGHYKDRKEGIDIWVTHQTLKKSTLQVKKSPKPILNDGEYFIDIGASETGKWDYYVFVYDNNTKIMVFTNDKSIKKKGINGGFFLPENLLYKKIYLDK